MSSPLNIFEGLYHLFSLNFDEFVTTFNNISIEFTWFVFLIIVFISILIFLKFFGEVGLYVYTSIAVIAANIQVLKIVKFSFFAEPVALGTILFASIFLCTDILAEYYGGNSARKNILISFLGFLLMTPSLSINIIFFNFKYFLVISNLDTSPIL